MWQSYHHLQDLHKNQVHGSHDVENWQYETLQQFVSRSQLSSENDQQYDLFGVAGAIYCDVTIYECLRF